MTSAELLQSEGRVYRNGRHRALRCVASNGGYWFEVHRNVGTEGMPVYETVARYLDAQTAINCVDREESA